MDIHTFDRECYTGLMTSRAEDIYREALALAPEDRERLAVRIMGSLEPVDSSVRAAWDEEIRLRVQELSDGRAETIAWSDVHRSLEEKLNTRGKA